MKNDKGIKVIAGITTLVSVALVVWLMQTVSVNGSLKENLRSERLKSESLLSEKLTLEKELNEEMSRLEALKKENGQLSQNVNRINNELSTQKEQLANLRRDNLTVAELRKQREKLNATRHQLENEITVLKDENAALQRKNSQLEYSVASLEERNRLLSDDLRRAMYASIDNAAIQAVKGKNERLTVRATKTRKLKASFTVPGGMKNLSYRITDANGNLLSKDGGITSNVKPAAQNLTASASEGGERAAMQEVQMEFAPKSKLKAGTYTIEILNDNLYVNSVKVRLR